MYFQLTLLWAAYTAAQTITGKTLRIMPLGDSITEGACGSNGNGYRAELVRLLDGNEVNLIGSTTGGSARDSQYEAHGGFGIDSIRRLAANNNGSYPNVYLVHAGTNDLYPYNNNPCAEAGKGDANDVCQKSMNSLDTLLEALKPSGALIVVAQITPSTNTVYNDRINIYNQLIARSVYIKNASNSGWKLQIANMQSADGITTAYIDPSCGGTRPNNDNIVHPSPAGYNRMANVWYKAIAYGAQANQISDLRLPTKVVWRACDNANQNYCDKITAFSGRGVVNRLSGVQCSGTGSTCNCQDSGSNSNYTVAKTISCAEMSVGYQAATTWADLNGDGRQENVFVNPDGSLNIALNTGPSGSTACGGSISSNFRNLNTKTIRTSKQYQVRLADLNGDGRAEYMVVMPNGDVTGYFNTGSKTTIANNIDVNFDTTAVSTGSYFGVSGVGVRFADFDGDGRADYIWVGAQGDLRVWLNRGVNQNTAAVSRWEDQGTITPALLSGTIRENVIIADVDADGRADYLIVSRNNGAVGAWLNKPPPAGSTKPNWTWAAIASDTDGSNTGAALFGNDIVFGDPDGDGNLDYLVTNYGDSSVVGLKNRCPNHYIS